MNAPQTLLPETMPGTRFVLDMDEEEYHAHPALSSTGMKNLLRSPKYFRMARSLHAAKPEFDVGHAVHGMVLGIGLPLVQIPFGLLSADGGIRSNAAKEFVAKARLQGKVPLKPATYSQVTRGAESILANPKARELLEREGFSECSLFAIDPESGVQLRARVDRLAGTTPVDLKTTTDVRAHKIQRAVLDFGYDVQSEAYRHIIQLVLDFEPDPMTLIFVEKEPPYEVRVVRVAGPWQEGGYRKMRAAIDLFAVCNEFGNWPGADDQDGPITDLDAPAFYEADVERALEVASAWLS